MEEETEAVAPLRVVVPVLAGTKPADSDGIDELEVAGIEAEGEPEVPALGTLPSPPVAEVVLDVPPALVVHMVSHCGELAEDLLRVLPDDIREDVQPAAVSHADHDIRHSLLAGPFEEEVEEGDQGLAPLERETLGTDELLQHELLEDRGVGELREDPQLAGQREIHTVRDGFHPLLEPLADLQIVDMHELDADRTRVGLAKPVEDRAGRIEPTARERIGRDPAVHVPRRKPVVVGIQLRTLDGGESERIKARGHMAADPVGPDELVDAVLSPRRRGDALTRTRPID